MTHSGGVGNIDNGNNICARLRIPFHHLPMLCFLSELLNKEGNNLTVSTPLLWCPGKQCHFCQDVSSWDLENVRETVALQGAEGSHTRGCQQPLSSRVLPGLVGAGRLRQQCGYGSSSSWPLVLGWCKSLMPKAPGGCLTFMPTAC